MTIQDKEFRILLESGDIQDRISQMAEQINGDYSSNPPLFIAVLNGAFMFASDLFKELKIQAEISFVKLASYNNTSSTGDVKQLTGLNETIFNRDVIVLEDIVDTGNTVVKLLDMIESLGPKSLEIATLLYKPNAIKHAVDLKYVGFEIPDNFVVGYGLDFNGIGRHYKDIYQLI